MYYSDQSGSDSENYEVIKRRVSRPGKLPFDPASLEKLILKLCDAYDFRVVMKKKRSKNAMLVTTGLTLAGTVIGKRYGGKVGAAVGGAVGGACGLGIVVVSMRDIWEDIKSKLTELLDIVYDYLNGLKIKDYKTADMVFSSRRADLKLLASLLVDVTAETLRKKVLSSLSS